MAIISHKITLIQTRRPVVRDVNEGLQWIGSSLGLFSLRDKDKSCFRIFIELLKSARNRDHLTSDDLAEKLGLSRGTVVHHLHKLADAGIVVSNRNVYILRVDNLRTLIEEIRKDIRRTMDDLSEVANEIDTLLGI